MPRDRSDGRIHFVGGTIRALKCQTAKLVVDAVTANSIAPQAEVAKVATICPLMTASPAVTVIRAAKTPATSFSRIAGGRPRNIVLLLISRLA